MIVVGDRGEEVGAAIRARRRELGLSMRNLGKIVGVSEMQISYIESGKRSIGRRYAEKLAEALGWKAYQQVIGEEEEDA